MEKLLKKFMTPGSFIIFGLLMLLGAEWTRVWPPLVSLQGIKWNNFLSNLGLYISVVASYQWYYDTKLKHTTIKGAVESAISHAEVVWSGIEKYKDDTKKINYRSIMLHSDEIIIGLLHSSRLVDDNLELLKQRANIGKKTTILLLKPNGIAFNYLLTLIDDEDHVKSSIRRIITRVNEHINQCENAKEKINVKYHNSVLRYSFVHSSDGVWVKMYRNSSGIATTPGIYVCYGTPLYKYFDDDIQKLKREAEND